MGEQRSSRALDRARHRELGQVVALAAALSGGGCSLVVDAGRAQCATDSDCVGLGGDPGAGVCVDSLCRPMEDPSWACLGGVSAAAPEVPDSVRIVVPFSDLLTAQPAPGVELRACAREDKECAAPLATATADEAGQAVVTLPGGFDGFFLWQAPNVAPAMYFIGIPFVADGVFPIGVISPADYMVVNAPFMDLLGEGRAEVLVTALSCDGTPAAGISVAVAGATEVETLYLGDGPFSPTLMATGQSGLVRLLNVPVGDVTITGTLPDGREIGAVSLFTHDTVSALANLGPSPR